ncbi:Chemotaxis protein CheW [Desulfonema magnum]|uniref:Chemotaxis protein CheW n=2 Tax=Desulfonema magnum TaxID=45655 RepID=A0A975BMR5_9BACT|nr:Chemotaxis protein CheW [Desulfonema magnum]
MENINIIKTSQYLTFKLGDEVFALDVAQVREVLDLTTITKVPRTPDFMRGVINVRGSVVPVVDLRLKFGLSETEGTLDTRIVVMELSLDGEITVIGAIADSVHEVLEIGPDQIEKPPKIGSRWRTEFIKGIGKQDEQFIIILDIERIFSTDELAIVEVTATDMPLPEGATEAEQEETELKQEEAQK